MRAPASLAALFAALCAASAARANPIDAFGFGARAAGLASAGTAVADDASANYYNPGALAFASSLRLDLGYRYASPHLRLDGKDQPADAAHGSQIGVVIPSRLGPLAFAVGLALALPDQGLLEVKTQPYTAPRFVAYGSRLQRLFAAANLAVRLAPGLSLGGGLSFLSGTSGAVGLQGVVGVTNPATSTLVSRIDVSLLSVRYPQAGLLWEPDPRVRVGLAFRGSYTLHLDTTLRIEGNLGDPGYAPLVKGGFFEVQTHVVEMFQPWQLALGLALRLRPDLLLALDATFARWSAAPAQQPLTDSLDLGALTPLVHLTPPPLYPSPDLRDTVTPRAGVEWRARDRDGVALSLRSGAAYERSPVPEQTSETNLADGDKLTFALGFGVEGQKPWGLLDGSAGLDLHLSATWMLPRANHKRDVAQPDFVASGLLWQAGTTARLRF